MSMTILQVLPRLNAGGVERGTLDIAKALIDAGHRAIVASAGGRMVKPLTQLGATHINLPLASKSPWMWSKNAQKLTHLIETHQIDCIHVRSRAPAWSVKLAAERTGIPWVTTFHGTYSLGPLGLKKPYNAIMTQANRVIAGSRFIQDHLNTHYHHNHSLLIPRGIDLAYFDPNTTHGDAPWPPSPNLHTFLLPGRITHWKGQRIFLQALAKLPTNAPAWQAILLGSSRGRENYAQQLDQIITDLKLNNRVQRLEHCDDIASAYQSADTVISAATEPEAFGRVAAEASAMQKPIIATAHGGSLEIVQDQTTGWLVPPNDVNALSQALLNALDCDPAQRQQIGEAGRQHVAEQFSLQQMCALTLQCYQDVLE